MATIIDKNEIKGEIESLVVRRCNVEPHCAFSLKPVEVDAYSLVLNFIDHENTGMMWSKTLDRWCIGMYHFSSPQVSEDGRFGFFTSYTEGGAGYSQSYTIYVVDIMTKNVYSYCGKYDECEVIQTGFDENNFVVIINLMNIYGQTDLYRIIKISLDDLILNEEKDEVKTKQKDKYNVVLKKDDFDVTPYD